MTRIPEPRQASRSGPDFVNFHDCYLYNILPSSPTLVSQSTLPRKGCALGDRVCIYLSLLNLEEIPFLDHSRLEDPSLLPLVMTTTPLQNMHNNMNRSTDTARLMDSRPEASLVTASQLIGVTPASNYSWRVSEKTALT